jgi:hypothetical protein
MPARNTRHFRVVGTKHHHSHVFDDNMQMFVEYGGIVSIPKKNPFRTRGV